MRTGLFILPFISLVLGVIAAFMQSAFADQPSLGQIGFLIALVPTIIWISLDFENFKKVFARRGSRYGASSGLTVLLGILVIVGIGFLTNKPRFNKSWDTTRSGVNTLSDQSTKVLKKIASEEVSISITGFIQDETVEQTLRDLIALYVPHAPNLKVQYLDPNIERTVAMAEKITSPNTAIIKRGQEEARITTFNEEKLTNALIKVLKDQSKKIYFLTGHGEGALDSQEIDGYSIIVEILKTNRYEVDTLSLVEKGSIPEDADLVVLAGPKYELREKEAALLEDYLKKGGAFYALVDAVTPVVQVNKLLVKFGLSFENDLLILRPDDFRAEALGQNMTLVGEFDAFNPVTKDFAAQQGKVVLTMANSRTLAAVEENEYTMKADLVGKASEVNIRVKDVLSEKDLTQLSEDRIEEGIFPVIGVSVGKSSSGPEIAQNGTTKKDVASDAKPESGASLSAKETRLVVVGSAQLATNFGVQRAENRDIVVNMVNYLLRDDDFISIRPKGLEKTTLDITSGESQLILLVLSYLYPLVFLGLGTYFYIRRRSA